MAGSIEHYELPAPKLENAPDILIVCAPYYKAIADHLMKGAQTALSEAKAKVTVIEVPGALEISTAIALNKSKYDGFVALGCVIRGATTHYETVCNDSSHALSLLGLQGLCIGNGILTVENFEQAEERADPARMNKGAGAALAALHLLAVREGADGGKRSFGFAPSSEHIVIASSE